MYEMMAGQVSKRDVLILLPRQNDGVMLQLS